MYRHTDMLKELDNNLTLNEKLEIVHSVIKERFNFIDRVAVASYDKKTDLLKTFISSGKANPLIRYSTPLNQAPSLKEILNNKQPRIINDLSLLNEGKHEHTRRINEQGYRSSYTMPIYLNGVFWGFIFFNSYQKDCFIEDVLQDLDLFGHFISNLISNEMAAIKILLGALKTANEMVHYRDPETGGHLDRMARFSRLIAQELAESGNYNFSDEYIEHIFLFAPLHDVGKISIPDKILLKAARLNEEEFSIMKTHTTKGVEIIDSIMDNFGLESFNSVNLLRNIIGFHHESLDGTGYPTGLKGEQLPIESRIVAVADIFDALASARPYKAAWTNAEAFAVLNSMAEDRLDRDCVDALIKNRDKVEKLQISFQDESFYQSFAELQSSFYS
jgi:HD-GYP domain-containing protein (c-di-GMP phosphodiesterase class II)